MTEEEYQRVQPVIEMAQRMNGILHRKLCEKGVEPIDALLGAVYSAHHTASEVHGGPGAAIEWMRDVLDTIERQVLDQVKPR